MTTIYECFCILHRHLYLTDCNVLSLYIHAACDVAVKMRAKYMTPFYLMDRKRRDSFEAKSALLLISVVIYLRVVVLVNHYAPCDEPYSSLYEVPPFIHKVLPIFGVRWGHMCFISQSFVLFIGVLLLCGKDIRFKPKTSMMGYSILYTYTSLFSLARLNKHTVHTLYQRNFV